MRETGNATVKYYLKKCLLTAWHGSFTLASSFTIFGMGLLGVICDYLGYEMSFPPGWQGMALSGLVYVGITWIILFVIRLIFIAPYTLFKNSSQEGNDLQKRLDDREAKQIGLNRLWELRVIGVKLRNNDEPVLTEEDFIQWQNKYTQWREEILESAQIVNVNLKNWLELLNTMQPYPNGLTHFNSEHARLMCMMTEILSRLEKYLITYL